MSRDHRSHRSVSQRFWQTLAAASTNGSSDGAGSQQAETCTEPVDTPSEPVAQDHQGAMAAGLAGSSPIVCGYTFDAAQIQQMQMPGAPEVNPEATIFVDDGTVYWNIPEPGGRVAHLLGLEGQVYSWKIPGDDSGVQTKDDTTDPASELAAQLTNNAHDCEAYTGPSSIFEVPSDITFQTVG